MARIRSLKPEAFQSETLSEVSLEAERTFLGLSTLADDRGRVADKPAVINGALWAVRSERKLHTAADVDSELTELEQAGALCRYIGCDGKRYLHFVTWDDHQKIDKASQSRQPRCPHHQSEKDRCGKHGDEACPKPPAIPAKSCPVSVTETIPPPPLPEPSRDSREDSANPREDEGKLFEDSSLDLGPRTVDQGSVPPSAGTAKPRPDVEATAGTILAWWLEQCRKRPPNQVIGQMGKQVKSMLGEGIEPDYIRRGLTEWMKRDVHPSVLPSLVNSVMNAAPNGQNPRGPNHQPPRPMPKRGTYDASKALKPRRNGS